MEISINEEIGLALDDEPELLFVPHRVRDVGPCPPRQANMGDEQPRESGRGAERTVEAERFVAAMRCNPGFRFNVSPVRDDVGTFHADVPSKLGVLSTSLL
jgi:hypothetical protein